MSRIHPLSFMGGVMVFFPIQRVIVPVDFTRVSSAAVEWARVFAAPEAAIDAFYVHQPPPAYVLGMPLPGLSKADKEALTKRLKSTYSVDTAHVDEGDPVAAIRRHSRRADLIVAGTHGRTGVDRVLLGSVSEAIVRASNTATLIIRKPPTRIKSILVPVNLQTYSKKGLHLAVEAALLFGAELEILWVKTESGKSSHLSTFVENSLRHLDESARRDLKCRTVSFSGNPIEEILRQSLRHGMVVLTAHRKSLIKDLVLGTTAERVLRHCSIPVMTAPSN
jgi:nucleotide-binding universal stress UspA family protein